MANTSSTPKDLGYILYPRRRPHEPGYPRLDVILRATPSEQHFDPCEAQLCVATPDQGVTSLSLELYWPCPEDYSVCAGPVELIDRKNKHLEVFTFGGSLHIQPGETQTLLILTSPAPIMLTTESPLDQLLVEEVEIILAQRQAVREAEPELYEKHLAVAPPLELYYAMLSAIQERYRHLPSSENELVMKLKHVVYEELNVLEETLSEFHRRPIEQLL